MLSKVFLLLALAARASAFASLPKAPAEESIETRSNRADAPNSVPTKCAKKKQKKCTKFQKKAKQFCAPPCATGRMDVKLLELFDPAQISAYVLDKPPRSRSAAAARSGRAIGGRTNCTAASATEGPSPRSRTA